MCLISYTIGSNFAIKKTLFNKIEIIQKILYICFLDCVSNFCVKPGGRRILYITGDKMNDRKQQVINKAHQLFIDKGFQATSIQDILEYSSISKGTFYNYFSSKNELLIAIFKNVFKQVEQGRTELLIGQDPSDIEIFIKQIEFQLKTNHENKLISLFEEVYFSKDEEINQYIKMGNFKSQKWLYERFTDIFGARQAALFIRLRYYVFRDPAASSQI